MTKFHASFIEALKKVERDDDARAFLEVYGTHFAQEVDMGSSLTIEKTFKQELSAMYEEDDTNLCKETSGAGFNSMQNLIAIYVKASKICCRLEMVYERACKSINGL